MNPGTADEIMAQLNDKPDSSYFLKQSRSVTVAFANDVFLGSLIMGESSILKKFSISFQGGVHLLAQKMMVFLFLTCCFTIRKLLRVYFNVVVVLDW